MARSSLLPTDSSESLQTAEPPMQPAGALAPSLFPALVEGVFRKVWNEFYEWEGEYSQQVISGLARPTKRPEPLPFDEDPPEHQNDPPDNSLSPDLNDLIVSDYSDGIAVSHRRLRMEQVEIALDLLPCSPYESCTPTSRNIFRGDDPGSMPFIPFADDPSFDHVRHTRRYSDFAWDTGEASDPDSEQYVSDTNRSCLMAHISLSRVYYARNRRKVRLCSTQGYRRRRHFTIETSFRGHYYWSHPQGIPEVS